MWCECDIMWVFLIYNLCLQVIVLIVKSITESNQIMWEWCDVMWWYEYPCYVNDISRNWLVRYFCGTSINAMSMISHGIGGWDISVVQVSMLYQWYLTKLVGEIFVGTNDACDTSELVIPVIPVIPVISVIQVILVIPVSPLIPVQWVQ